MSTFSQKVIDFRDAWQDKDIALLHTLFHKLAGSSGSYGFADLSILCRTGMNLTAVDISINNEKIDKCLLEIYKELKLPKI